jgi:RimJ/RimL family protein N-acetyltransferase
VIPTARTILRPVEIDDCRGLLEHWSRPLVRRWLWDDRLPTADEVTAIVDSSSRTWRDEGYGFWIIESPDDSAMLGTVGFREASWESGVCELVYSLDPEWWGKGLATEVARAALEWAFTTHGWPRIIAATDTPNEMSSRVLGRVGMRLVREGDLESGLPTLFYEVLRR